MLLLSDPIEPFVNLETRVTFRGNFDCKLFNFQNSDAWDYIFLRMRDINTYKPVCARCESLDLFLGRCLSCGHINE